jgi:hypothetical protein
VRHQTFALAGNLKIGASFGERPLKTRLAAQGRTIPEFGAEKFGRLGFNAYFYAGHIFSMLCAVAGEQAGSSTDNLNW